ncbi:hypothetical protein OB955_23945 [Halobacteria archaeon AArc-m2/3/4]|uniref:Uncharacterized protein n=1 Tax=Natronoglomus mannanivorans TaxID=2979990 RepID=A0AAP2Z4A4_9EURY|nr:hypothetical protein [Halobacteria archaeon AArc-xg1-1]MCU4975739.1 hypothetical protein [Halobacteria archaeon AArc-m2/3/4]
MIPSAVRPSAGPAGVPFGPTVGDRIPIDDQPEKRSVAQITGRSTDSGAGVRIAAGRERGGSADASDATERHDHVDERPGAV